LKDTDYTSLTGALRVSEKKLLQTDGIERVIDAPNAADAAKALSQVCDYDFSALKRPEDYETVLSAQLKQTYSFLYNNAPDKAVVDIILAKYDYHNLKVALKSKYLGQSGEEPYVSYTPFGSKRIKDTVIDAAKPDGWPKHLTKAAAEGEKAFEETKNPQSIDIALDKLMFAYQTELARLTENDYIIEYVRLTVDFYNLKVLLRVKNMDRDLKFLKESLCEGGSIKTADFTANFDKDPVALADVFHYKYFGGLLKTAIDIYEQTGNFGNLEKLLDNYLIERIKKSKYIAIGPEILLSYIFSKENEARQIRIIMACKINNITPDVLRERLRDNYV